MNTETTTTTTAANKGDAIIWEDIAGAEYSGIYWGEDTTGCYLVIWQGGAQPRLVKKHSVAAARFVTRELD